MDKTNKISLGGFSFIIEEAAYKNLQQYIEQIKHYLGQEKQSEEIIYDIEQRMSELLKDRMKGREVVICSDIDYLIEVMGKPEQYDLNQDSQEDTTDKDSFEGRVNKTFKKKLYRDPQDKKLAGVLSGVASYFDLDSTIVRLVYLLLLIVSFVFLSYNNPSSFFFWIALYFIFWYCVPEAKTVSQKLHMKGEEINIDTISSLKTQQGNAKRLSRDMKNKLLAGVISGFANHYNIKLDVSWIRIIYLLLVFGMIPFTDGISSLLIPLYLVFWMILPKDYATTDQDAPLQNKDGFGLKLFRFISMSVVVFFALILAVVILSVMFSIIAIFSVGSNELFEYMNLFFNTKIELWFFYSSIAIFMLLSVSFFCLFVFKISIKDFSTPKVWTYTNISMLLFLLLTAITLTFRGFSYFREMVVDTQRQNLNIGSDTIYLKYHPDFTFPLSDNYEKSFFKYKTGKIGINSDYIITFDDKLINKDIDVKIKTIHSEAPYLEILKTSYGVDKANAKQSIDKIVFPLKVDGDTIFIPQYMSLSDNSKIRIQSVDVVLYVPSGVKVIDQRKDDLDEDDDFSDDIDDVIEDIRDEIRQDIMEDFKDEIWLEF